MDVFIASAVGTLIGVFVGTITEAKHTKSEAKKRDEYQSEYYRAVQERNTADSKLERIREIIGE